MILVLMLQYTNIIIHKTITIPKATRNPIITPSNIRSTALSFFDTKLPIIPATVKYKSISAAMK